MAEIGLNLGTDSLVLTKGRDFKWSFQNLDNNRQAIPFPAGDLFFELQTRNETNAIQEVTVQQATGGTYKLEHGGSWTAPIDFNDVTNNPQNLSGDITDALVALPTIGAGNVDVHPSTLYPVWELDLTVNAGKVLTEQLVNTLNVTLNNLYNTFPGLLGVTVDFTIHDNLNATVKVISNRTYNEVGLITFAVDVTNTVIANAFNAVASLVGLFSVIHVDFYWVHKYIVEFTGINGLKPQPKLGVDYSLLTGINTPSVSVEVLEPGKHPLTLWHFTIDGSLAHLKVESEEVDKIVDRTPWQLVFLTAGETPSPTYQYQGGDPVALGITKIKAPNTWVPA